MACVLVNFVLVSFTVYSGGVIAERCHPLWGLAVNTFPPSAPGLLSTYI